MRSNVIQAFEIPSVPKEIYRSSQFRDICCRDRNPVSSLDVVFRTNMHKSQRQWRQPRHRIIIMRYPEIPTLVLSRDIITQRRPGKPWLPIRIQISIRASIPYLSRSNRCDGAAEAVSDHDDFVGGVCGCGGFEGGGDAGGGFFPAGVEAFINCATRANICGCSEEVDVGYVVAD